MTRHRRRPLARTRLVLAWVLLVHLAPLWAMAYLVAVAVAIEPKHRHWHRNELHPRQLVRLYRWVAGRRPGRYRPAVYAVQPPARMVAREVGACRTKLAARDGLWCQNACGRILDPHAPHRGPGSEVYPHVHHLRSWARHKHEWWVNALWNLCLLCPECNLRIGPGSTPTLDLLAERLVAEEVAAGRLQLTAA